MIGKVSKGSSFGGLSRYLTRHAAQEHGLQDYLLGAEEMSNRVEWTAVRNISTNDPKYAATIMSATAEENVRVTKSVCHLSLAADPCDELSREDWERIADRVLGELGLSGHQVLIVVHNDTEHPHIRLMINRVNPRSLKAWDNSHDYRRIEKILRHIERDLGLRQVPGHHYRLPEQQRPEREGQETSGEREQRRRTGEPSWADQVRFRTCHALRESESWKELELRLARHGLRLQRRGGGLVVTDGQRMVKASRLYRRASYRWLERRFGKSYEEWRAERDADATRSPGQGQRGRETAPHSASPENRHEVTTEPAEQEIRFRAYGVLRGSSNWGGLERGLAGQGLRLKQRGGDLLVTDGEHQVAASRIYRRASSGWMKTRFGMSFEQWRRDRRALLDAVDRYQQACRREIELDHKVDRAYGQWEDATELVQRRDDARRASRAAAGRLEGKLREIYHPTSYPKALRRIAADARRDGWEETARRVARRPQRYGRLASPAARGLPLGRARRERRQRLLAAGSELAARRAGRHRAGPAGNRAARLALAAKGKMLRLQARKARIVSHALRLDVAHRALALGISAVSLAVAPRPLKVSRTALQTASLVRSLRDRGRQRGR